MMTREQLAALGVGDSLYRRDGAEIWEGLIVRVEHRSAAPVYRVVWTHTRTKTRYEADIVVGALLERPWLFATLEEAQRATVQPFDFNPPAALEPIRLPSRLAGAFESYVLVPAAIVVSKIADRVRRVFGR